MLKQERAVVLLSGGIDSAVCLWLARENNWEIHTISFNYHNRLRREIDASVALAERAGVAEHKTVDLPFLRELEDHEIKPAGLAEQTEIPTEYIPGRNLIFYSIAASWAESVSGKYVVGGHNSHDHSRFSDSTPEFFTTLNELIRSGMLTARKKPIEVITPLSGMDKVGVIKEAIRLKVPLELTWSCYERDDLACRTCPACRTRLQAFSSLDLQDPIPYAGATVGKRFDRNVEKVKLS